ncbi:MAG: PAS domain S-box protein [Terriglobia bacterium]
MGKEFTPRDQRWLRAVPPAAAAASILAGVAVMLGWIFDVPLLRSFLAGQPPMRPLRAPTFILAGLSLWFLRKERGRPGQRRFWRVIGRVCALGVVGSGSWTLAEYFLGWYPGIDQLVAGHLVPSFRVGEPTAIAPIASPTFVLVGCGLLALDWGPQGRFRPTEFLAFGAVLEGMFGLLDFLLHPAIFTMSVSIYSSMLFLLLGGALLISRPEHRVRMLLTSRGPGGGAFRRLFAAALMVPVVLGWLIWRGQRAGQYPGDLGMTLIVVMSSAALVVIAFWTTDTLDRTELERVRAQEALRRSEKSLAEAQRIAHLGNWDWDIVENDLRWSDEIYRVFGLTPQVFGATYEAFLESVHPDDRGSVKNAVDEALAERKAYSLDHRIVLPDGTVRIVHEQAEVFFDAGRKPGRMLGTVQDITERKQVEEALRRASVYNRNLIETSLDPLVTIARDGTITDVNRATEKATGFSRAELVGTDFSDYFTDRGKARAGYERVFREGSVQDYELEIRDRNGHTTPVLYNASVYRDEAGQVVGVFAAARDISEQRRAEREMRRLNRALRTLSECNQAIVRARDELELLHEICRNLVQHGGYLLAWVGYAEQDEAKSLRPVASAGLDRDYLASAKITWADCERGRGPTGLAIRTGQPSVMRDVCQDADFAPWREEAARHGFGSSIALPLVMDDQALGALMVYAKTPNAFDDEEVRLLTELAHDLAYGIQTLRTRAERTRAEEKLLGQLRMNEAFFSQAVSCFALLDPQYNFIRVNEAYAKACRRKAEAFPGRNHFDLYPSDAKLIFDEVVSTKKPFQTLARPFRFEDQPERGVTYWDWTLVPVLDEQGQLEFLVISLNEVTERKRAEEELRQLSARLLRTQDEERRRIARELHDSTGQSLAALAMNLAALQEWGGALAPVAQATLAESLDLVNRSSREIRDFSYLLHPPVLDEFGLASALRWYVKGFAERSGIEVDLEISPGLRRLPRETETALFRIVQECLANIRRHSGSPAARIRIRQGLHQLLLEVEDEGRGIPTAQLMEGAETVRPGVGVTGMRERMRQLGGQLEISSNEQGTTVRATMPLLQEAA